MRNRTVVENSAQCARREDVCFNAVDFFRIDGPGVELTNDSHYLLLIDITDDELYSGFMESFSEVVADMPTALQGNGPAGEIVRAPPVLC